MSWLKKIWNDPVGSKVISGIILAMLGVAYSAVKAWLVGGKSVQENLAIVFGYKVNVWIALACLLIILAVTGIVKRKKEKKEKEKDPPLPPFVNDFTEGMYQGQRWKWRWQWSESNSFYYMEGLSIVCPACKEGLLSTVYMSYRCGKCGADIPYQMLNTNHKSVKKQILEDVRQKYSNFKEYIGELSSETN